MLLWLAAHPIASAAVALLCAAAISLTASWLAGRALAARHRSTAAAALGEPQALERCVVGEPATLEGVLDAEETLKRPSDGKPAAVVTLAVAKHRLRSDPCESVIHLRASRLAVRVDGKPVLLRGPVDVRAGGLQWWPMSHRRLAAAGDRMPDDLVTSEPWTGLSHDRAVFFSIAAGDRVRVRGIVDSDSAAATYREQAVALELTDVVLVGMDRPRVAIPLAQKLRSPALLVMAAAAIATIGTYGYRYAQQVDACVQPCFSRGECTVVQPQPLRPRFTCAAVTREDCAQSTPCRVEGKCTPDGEGGCEIARDADCAASLACAEKAQCSLEGERYKSCRLVSDADCQKSRGCKEEGRCIKFFGVCVADLAEACAATNSCLTRGECKPNDKHECTVGSSADCAQSKGCTEHGFCTAVSYDNRLSCVAASDEDCARCDDCRDQGKCTLLSDRCAVVGDADCAALCNKEGRCHAVAAGENTLTQPGSCRAESDADCKASVACKQRGACKAVRGRCVAPSTTRPDDGPDCKRTDKCLEYGWCGEKNGACAVTSDADCALSKLCEQQGKCSAVNGICTAKTDEDCRRSEACTLLSQCFAAAGQCMSTPPH